MKLYQRPHRDLGLPCGIIALHMLTGVNPSLIQICIQKYRENHPVDKRGFDCRPDKMDQDFEGIYHTEILYVLKTCGFNKRWVWLKRPMQYEKFFDAHLDDHCEDTVLVHSDNHYAIWREWMVWDTRNAGSFWEDFDLKKDKVHGYIQFKDSLS